MLPTRRDERGPATVEPFSDLERLRRQLTSLLDEPWTFTPSRLTDGRLLLADLEETDDEFILEIDLPGVRKEDIEIELEGRRVIVFGERKERERVGILRRRSRTVGEFRHEVTLPADVDEDEVRARLEDGVLTIHLAKTEASKRRRIEVS